MTKTINLTGAEVAVVELDGAHAHITNMGADIIYAAKTAGITAGADGVVPIPAGNGNTLRGISGVVYLLGTGSVLVQSDDYVQHPSFRNSTASGGSAVDEVARTALGAHEGNSEIHVTADEKAAWNGKADTSDIPTSLPADGGNADTVGGFPISDNGACGVVVIQSDQGIAKMGQHIDFYINSESPFLGRITRDSNGFWFFNSDTSKATLYADVGGSAAMLGNHLAEDYVLKTDYEALKSDHEALKSDYVALEERVAALEGGTT